MDICKLGLKLGPNEVEGPQEYVEKQREMFLAQLRATQLRAAEPVSAKAVMEKESAHETLDLGNGNTVIAPSSNLHATWKI